MKSPSARFVLSTLRLLALLLMLAGVWQVFNDVTFSMRALPSSGFVLDLEDADSAAGRGIKPVIGFFDAVGRKHTGLIDTVFDRGVFILAQEVPILYDTATPENIELASGFHPLRSGGMDILLGGGLFFFLGKLSRRPRKPAAKKAGQTTMHALKKRPALLSSPESAADHARESTYQPTVRRMR